MEIAGKAVFLTGGAKGIGLALCDSLLKKGAKVLHTGNIEVAGKAVFTAGGARGIGLALCGSLQKIGAKVFFCDIDTTTGKATEAELQKQYGVDKVIFAQCDVSDADHFTGVFQKAVDTFGAVDVFVNNAGMANELSMERLVAVNMMGQIRGSQMAMEHMRRDKGGRGGVIINVVSTTGLKACYHLPVYSATKHAVIGFTQSWATNPRTKDMSIRWGSLCPGAVKTDLTKELMEGQVVDVEKHALRIQKCHLLPSEVADAFMTLLEDEESNGAIMTVSASLGGANYKKRQLVDVDGVSNPLLVDAPGI